MVSFGDSVHKTYTLLKNNLVGGFVVESAGSSVLYFGAFAFSTAVTFSAWAGQWPRGAGPRAGGHGGQRGARGHEAMR